MNLRGLLTDEDALSPVIGVVLMVAVTVVLSAAVGAFVLDIGSEVTKKSPNVVVEYDFDVNGSGTETLTLQQTGGNPVSERRITVIVNGTEAWRAGSAQAPFTSTANEWSDGLEAGDSLVLEANTSHVSRGDHVQIIWQDGERSQILSTEQVG